MIVNHLSGEARSRLLDVLASATAEKPATRQAIAVAGNVALEQVGELLSALRLQGYLVIETESGCWLATSYQEYRNWRTNTLIPAMVQLLQTDQAMALNAAIQFGAGRVEAA